MSASVAEEIAQKIKETAESMEKAQKTFNETVEKVQKEIEEESLVQNEDQEYLYNAARPFLDKAGIEYANKFPKCVSYFVDQFQFCLARYDLIHKLKQEDQDFFYSKCLANIHQFKDCIELDREKVEEKEEADFKAYFEKWKKSN
jgi:coenzyme F420-reducing hydrogenase alpha subunit